MFYCLSSWLMTVRISSFIHFFHVLFIRWDFFVVVFTVKIEKKVTFSVFLCRKCRVAVEWIIFHWEFVFWKFCSYHFFKFKSFLKAIKDCETLKRFALFVTNNGKIRNIEPLLPLVTHVKAFNQRRTSRRLLA